MLLEQSLKEAVSQLNEKLARTLQECVQEQDQMNKKLVNQSQTLKQFSELKRQLSKVCNQSSEMPNLL